MHFDDIAWVDFVRRLLTAEESQLMQRHLTERCSECSLAYAFWSEFADMISREPQYEPNASDIRIVSAAFAGAGSAMALPTMRKYAHLIFDSFRDAAPAGFRSVLMQSRYVVFRADQCTVSLRVKREPANEVFLAGHISQGESAKGDSSRFEVSLVQGQTTLGTATTNRSGEFHLHYRDGTDVSLLVRLSDTETLELRIPDQEPTSEDVIFE